MEEKKQQQFVPIANEQNCRNNAATFVETKWTIF